MTIQTEDILKLLLALALGGLIGAEREYRDKAAGLRTLMFICAGSALFTIFSSRLAANIDAADPTRIAAQIVTGIGFLGGGVILRERGEIHGLTTASTIWLVAALGVGVGGGQYLFSTLSAIFIMATLLIFPFVEAWMGRLRQVYTYEVTAPASHDKYWRLCQAFRENKLSVIVSKQVRTGDQMVCTWTVTGRSKNHQRMMEALFDDPEIKEFKM